MHNYYNSPPRKNAKILLTIDQVSLYNIHVQCTVQYIHCIMCNTMYLQLHLNLETRDAFHSNHIHVVMSNYWFIPSTFVFCLIQWTSESEVELRLSWIILINGKQVRYPNHIASCFGHTTTSAIVTLGIHVVTI